MTGDTKSQPQKVGQQFGEIRQSISVDKLNAYLSSHVPSISSPVTVKQFSYGQSNPTYILTDSRGSKYVLRKKPPGNLLSPTAHAVEREYRVLKAIGEHNHKLPGDRGSGPQDDQRLKHPDAVPVPAVYCLCQDNEVVGTPFYIMQFVEGRIFADYRMIEMAKEDREKAWQSACRTLGALHRIDPEKVGLKGFGKPSDFYARQLKGLGGIALAQSKAKDKDTGETLGPIPHFEKIVGWLAKNMPPDQTGIVHGDYKIDNLIFHPSEPRVIGVLDWELATLGHPYSDVGNLLQPFTLPCPSPSSASSKSAFLDAVKKGELMYGLGGLSKELCPVPTKEENLETYCKATGRKEIAEWDFCEAWAWFRLAVIAHGIAARVAQKQASSAEAKVYASKYPLCAQSALQIIQRAEAKGRARL